MARAFHRSYQEKPLPGHNTPLYGELGGQHFLAGFIDHWETFGPQVVEYFVSTLQDVRSAVDLGAGSGRDLEIVKRLHPTASTAGIEWDATSSRRLTGKVDRIYIADIERDPLPLERGTVDLILANQVLEHTKEIFWIFHEVTRCLPVGGHLILGVPNICSFHNRVLMLAGRHPTQHKLCSAHVRPFSKPDTLKFLNACFPGGYELVSFRGAQFYPFPAKMARILARLLPTLAFSIYFLLRKSREYTDEFRTYPARAHFQTNFWSGERVSNRQP